MKKLMSLIGALFVGTVTFAQVSKTEEPNKTVSRKVLEGDVKNLPPDDASKTQIHGSVTQKGKATATQDYHIKIGSADKSAIKVEGKPITATEEKVNATDHKVPNELK
jgi:hypothetical protein